MKGKIMKIWKLTVVEEEINNPDWELSTRKETVIVRAKNKVKARELATDKFCIARMRVNNNSSTPGNPWGNSDLVICNEIPESSDYKLDGEPEVLFPQ
jgi:hypothetical protein